MANARETAKRAFSASGLSPPLFIIPANSLRSMKPFAPSCSTSLPFSGEDTTPTHSAPAPLQSWVAKTPSPPAAPQISTLWPDCRRARSISMRYAVKYVSP